MKFTSAVVCAFVSAGSVSAFTQKPTAAFLQSSSHVASAYVSRSASASHAAGCNCGLCGSMRNTHDASCACTSCRSSTSRTMVFAVESSEGATAEAVPAEVEALDGINSETEAHNAERPARKSLKKKGPKGTPLADLTIGSTVKAKVKTLTSYGAFLDIGAETDGLLHISQLSVDFVSDVKDVLEVDKEYDVRITGVDVGKKQISLTLLTEEQEAQAAENAQRPAKRNDRQQSSSRSDDSAVLISLKEKGFDSDKFVEGTVVSTVDFGAFVRIDCSQLNSEVEGSFDGLVHISSLAPGRVNSVTDVVSVDDKVQVRVKGIEGTRKVSLSMISADQEQATRGGGGPAVVEGNKDWKEALEAKQKDLPVFKNNPMVIDKRT